MIDTIGLIFLVASVPLGMIAIIALPYFVKQQKD